MWKELIIFSVALTGAATAGSSQEKPSVPGVEAIATRQDAMDMSSITLRSMVDAMKDGREPKAQAYPAAALEKWAKALPAMFPPGTGEGETSVNSQALSAIWRDRAGFDRAAADYAHATAKLSALAAANDTPGFTKELDEVSHACNSCHSRYKAGAQGPPSPKAVSPY